MASYGQIKIKTADREEIHILSFNDKTVWFDTERWLRKIRPDLIIVDSFWGYALFDNEYKARDAINAFAPLKGELK